MLHHALIYVTFRSDLEGRKMRIKNPMAADLRTPKYRKRVVRSRVKYTRKSKHKAVNS